MVEVYRGRGRSRVVVKRRDDVQVLRIRGTFASWYRTGRATTGAVWDLLAAPLLALPPARRRRALLLGLGGASAARVLRALAPRMEIVGVEIDADVVVAAKRFFDLDALGVRVVVADARAFLETDRSRYDLVIDDVFVGAGRRPRKPEWLPEPGLSLAARRVRRGGILVANALDEAAAVARVMRRLHPACVRLALHEFDNRVYAGGPAGLAAGTLRTAIAASPVLAPILPGLSIRTLSGPRTGTPAPRG